MSTLCRTCELDEVQKDVAELFAQVLALAHAPRCRKKQTEDNRSGLCA